MQFGVYSFLLILLWGALGSISGHAQTKVKPMAIAEVVQDAAMVYQRADFDSPVVSYLTAGDQVAILSKKQGPFYKIQIKSITGYIADVDVHLIKVGSKTRKSVFAKNAEDADEADEDSEDEMDDHLSTNRAFGLEFRQIEFRETTSSRFLKEDMSGTGLKVAGKNLLVEGDIPMEMNFFFINRVPDYYQKRTLKESGSGLIFLGDATFITPFSGNSKSMFFSGFGPMIRYSQFSVTAGSTGSTYSMVNLNIGVIASLGYAVRLGSLQLRMDYKYFWEKMQHNGFGISLLWDASSTKSAAR